MMISVSTSTRSRLCARRGAGVRRAAAPPCDTHKVSFYSFYLLLGSISAPSPRVRRKTLASVLPAASPKTQLSHYKKAVCKTVCSCQLRCVNLLCTLCVLG